MRQELAFFYCAYLLWSLADDRPPQEADPRRNFFRARAICRLKGSLKLSVSEMILHDFSLSSTLDQAYELLSGLKISTQVVRIGTLFSLKHILWIERR